MTINRVALLLSDFGHPIYPALNRWASRNAAQFNITLVEAARQLPTSGDILFLVSCSEFIPHTIRQRFRYVLVLHASALPQGKGWSPHIWSVIEGATQITVSLINAEDKIDSGDIWQTVSFALDGTELYREINEKLFAAELELIDWACQSIEGASANAQSGEESFLRKRTAEDSRIDPNKSIAEQFDLLRVCDDERFPAFFEHRGQRYRVRLEKTND